MRQPERPDWAEYGRRGGLAKARNRVLRMSDFTAEERAVLNAFMKLKKARER